MDIPKKNSYYLWGPAECMTIKGGMVIKDLIREIEDIRPNRSWPLILSPQSLIAICRANLLW